MLLSKDVTFIFNEKDGLIFLRYKCTPLVSGFIFRCGISRIYFPIVITHEETLLI